VNATQASAADNGQCLVHDVSHEDSNGIVDGLINHVAAANVSEGRDTPDAVRALVWHPAGVLLLGTESGARVGVHTGECQLMCAAGCRRGCETDT
jgi:hypothetical protein